MKKYLIYISAACFAFTFSSLFYLLFRQLGIFPPLTERMSITLFLVSALITCFMYLTHLLPFEQPLVVHFLEVLCIVLVLTAGGAFFDMFPLDLYHWSTVLLSGLLAYAFVIALIYLNTKADERKINEVIAKKRSGASGEQH